MGRAVTVIERHRDEYTISTDQNLLDLDAIHGYLTRREAVTRLQVRLDQAATAKTKAWWENYLKQAISFRGAKMADIRAALHAWIEAEGFQQDLSPGEQLDLALSLFHEPYAEDKLAGILYLQEALLPAGAIDWRADLPRFARLFDEVHIADWNTCDWFCVKVLGPLVERALGLGTREGERCARAIAEWRRAEVLWRHRASGVAFVNLAKRGEENFCGFTDMLLDVCATLVRREERFAQTGAGWVLRELSLAEPERVAAFVEAHRDDFSKEALDRATSRIA
jgi:3-methyladenine DNA glycosylase AlkD